MNSDEKVVYDDKARRMVEQMVLAEQRHIAQRLQEDCECKEGMFPRRAISSRRGFLFAAGSIVGAAGASRIARAESPKAPPGAVLYDVPDDPTKEQGRAVAADGGYGSRSQFETEVRWRFPTPRTRTPPGA